MVVITGDAGIGKSRLAVEVVRRRLDFAVVFARCQPFDRLSAYSVADARSCDRCSASRWKRRGPRPGRR